MSIGGLAQFWFNNDLNNRGAHYDRINIATSTDNNCTINDGGDDQGDDDGDGDDNSDEAATTGSNTNDIGDAVNDDASDKHIDDDIDFVTNDVACHRSCFVDRLTRQIGRRVVCRSRCARDALRKCSFGLASQGDWCVLWSELWCVRRHERVCDSRWRHERVLRDNCAGRQRDVRRRTCSSVCCALSGCCASAKSYAKRDIVSGSRPAVSGRPRRVLCSVVRCVRDKRLRIATRRTYYVLSNLNCAARGAVHD